MRVAYQPDVSDRSRWHQFEHALEQSVACAQDRNQDRFSFLEKRCLHPGQRRLDGAPYEVQITQDLVADHRCEFTHDPAEGAGSGFPGTQEGEPVLNQGMIDHGDARHGLLLPAAGVP